MNEDILKTKELITNNLNHPNYKPVYTFTNENIDGYMSKLDFNNKSSALSVLSSGDHMFNAILHGIKDIDNFDINRLTEYYALGLKRSAILKFNYYEFINFMNKLTNSFTNIDEINDLINLIIPYMDDKYKIYFKEIIDYIYKISKETNQSNLFYYLLNDPYELKGNMMNTYLKDEDNYNLLKNMLGNTNITFTNCDITLLPSIFNKQYDFIFLSNILDYLFSKYGYNWNYQQLQELEKSFFPLLNKDGIIALHYIYFYFFKKRNHYKPTLINSSSIRLENLTCESIITFNHTYQNYIEKDIDAGLILIKKH